jgi:Uma2 family endonuclease
MQPAVAHSAAAESLDQDARVHMSASWPQFQTLLKVRGDASWPRMAYAEGLVEFMTPSSGHEGTKKLIAGLLEIYALERDLPLNRYGSWLVKSTRAKQGLEPDECYVLGMHRPAVPDLAIEIDWTSGGLDKLAIYRALKVPEVWIWSRATERLEVHVLNKGRYRKQKKSALLPELDLALLVSHLGATDHTRAIRAFRDRLLGR